MQASTVSRQEVWTSVDARRDRRHDARVALDLDVEIALAGNIRLPCHIHDVNSSAIGITIDPKAVAELGGRRLSVRRGDRVAMCFKPQRETGTPLEPAQVQRVWCRSGIVEMGLRVVRARAKWLQALARARARGACGSSSLRRRWSMTPRELDALLSRVADETFPRIAQRLERIAEHDDTVEMGTLFRALVRINASRHDIARRFVHAARAQLMPGLADDAPFDQPQHMRFDHLQIAETFATACDLGKDQSEVSEAIEELVVAAGYRQVSALTTKSL